MARLQTDARRAQLIALGVDLFTSRPYDEVSIEEIARQAGVSKGLLYHYFGGKRSYYVACLEAAADALATSVVDHDPTADPPARLREGLNRYFDWAEARADAYLALMHGGMGRDPEVVALMDRTRARILDDLLTEIGLTEVPPAFRVASRAWLGAVEAAAQDWLAFRDLAREALVEMLAVQLGVALTMAALQDPRAAARIDLQLDPQLGALLAAFAGA